MTDKEDRKDDAVNKVFVIWEAIRRNPRYIKLHALLLKNKNNAAGSWKYQIQISREFGVNIPIDPSEKASKIGFPLLKMYFHKGAFAGVPLKVLKHMNTSKDRYIDFHLTADMTKSCDQLCSEFKVLMTSVKKSRKKLGLDKQPEIGSKKRLHIYDVKDYEIYDRVNELRKKNKSTTFHQIAKSLLAGKAASSYAVDIAAKSLENTYGRASWTINGGYRVLM